MNKERNYQPVLVVLVLIVIGVAAWNLFTDWQDRQAETARQQENKEWRQQAEALSKKVAELETELKTVQDEKAPGGKAAEVFGPDASAGASPEKPSGVESNERQIQAFFNYLDGRDYVKAYALEGGTYAYYTAAVAELSASLPKVAGETESLYTTLKNVSHFFRVLGKKRTELAAEILKNEQEILEPTMRVFYQWVTGPAGTLQGKALAAGDVRVREFLHEHARRPELPDAPRFQGPAAHDLLQHPDPGPGQRQRDEPERDRHSARSSPRPPTTSATRRG